MSTAKLAYVNLIGHTNAMGRIFETSDEACGSVNRLFNHKRDNNEKVIFIIGDFELSDADVALIQSIVQRNQS